MRMDYMAMWWLSWITKGVIVVLILYGAYRLRKVVKGR